MKKFTREKRLFVVEEHLKGKSSNMLGRMYKISPSYIRWLKMVRNRPEDFKNSHLAR